MYQKRNNWLEVVTLYLGGYDRQFYLREISRLAKLPLKSVQTILLSLEKCRSVKSSVRGKNKYFRLNLDNPLTKLDVLQAEIYRTQLFLKRYPLFRTFQKEVLLQVPIVVFGSFAKFSAEQDSDLDLLIISKHEEKLPLHLLPYKVHEIRLSGDSFKKAIEKKEALIKEVEENHIILNDHSYYVNTMWSHYAR